MGLEITNNGCSSFTIFTFFFSRNRKKSSTVNHHLSVAVVNSLWSILTGEKITHGDERVTIVINDSRSCNITRKYPSYYLMQITYITKQIKEIVTSTSEFILKESLVGPLMVFPWLRHLPFIASKFKASKQHPLKMRRLQVCNKCCI